MVVCCRDSLSIGSGTPSPSYACSHDSGRGGMAGYSAGAWRLCLAGLVCALLGVGCDRSADQTPELTQAERIETLIQDLGTDEANVHRKAADALIGIGEPAVGPVLAAAEKAAGQDPANAKWLASRTTWPGYAAVSDRLDIWASAEVLQPGFTVHDETIAGLREGGIDGAKAAAYSGYSRGPAEIPDLIRLLSDHDSLSWISDGNYVSGGDTSPAKEARKRLVSMGAVTVTPLLAALRAENSSAGGGAEDVLTEIGAAPTEGSDRAWYLVVRYDYKGAAALGPVAVEPLAAKARSDSGPSSRATEALGMIGDKHAIDVLIELLHQEDFSDRSPARNALVEVGPPAVEPLVAALQGTDTSLHGPAVRILGLIGDKRAAAPLTAALRTPLSSEAAKALDALNAPPTEGLDLAWYLVAQGDYKGAAAVGPVAAEPLAVAVQRNPRSADTPAMVEALVTVGEPAVAPLIPVLSHENSRCRAYAAEALARIGDERGVVGLVAALQEKDWRIRLRAAEALGGIGDKRGVVALIAALQEQGWRARSQAAEALARLGNDQNEQVARAIVESFDSSRGIEHRKAEILVAIGEPAVRPLIAALQDKDKDTVYRGAAARVLGGIGDKRAVEPLIAALQEDIWYVADALGEIGDKRAVVPLIAVLQDGGNDNTRRRFAAEALGQLGDARAVESLLAVMQNKDDPQRGAAMGALGDIGDKRAVLPLLAALQDKGFRSRRGVAMIALGKIGDERAVAPLLAALQAGSMSAVQALGRLGDKRAVAPLVAVMQDESNDRSDRSDAIGALGRIGGQQAVDALVAVLQDDDDAYHGFAIFALGRIGDKRAVPALIAFLQDEDHSYRHLAADALGEIGDKRAVPALTAAAKDRGDVGHRARQALDKINAEP